MPHRQDHIERIRAFLQSHIDSAVDQATAVFLTHLGDHPFPGASEVVAANSAARLALKHHVLSEEWLSAVAGDTTGHRCSLPRLELAFDSLMPVLAIPQPQDASTMSPVRLALAAAVGSVLGMIVLTPLAHLLLDMRDTGLFLGAPLGAAGLVIACWYVAHTNWVRRLLIAFFSVATIAEVWALVSGGVLGPLWRRLGLKRSGMMKRVLSYGVVILLLTLARRTPRYDHRGYERAVAYSLRQWVDEALMTVEYLLRLSTESSASPQFEEMLVALIAKITELGSLDKDKAEIAIRELAQEVRNMGFSGGTGLSQFVWEESFRGTFETFAHIEPGDLVSVEREPVCFQHSVKQKGLVRKVRDRS